jgi:hypothetical protein
MTETSITLFVLLPHRKFVSGARKSSKAILC